MVGSVVESVILSRLLQQHLWGYFAKCLQDVASNVFRSLILDRHDERLPIDRGDHEANHLVFDVEVVVAR
jgi:hypothetical protein